MDADVIVCGAGPVGLSVTLFLAQAGVKVLLLEMLPDIDNSPRYVNLLQSKSNQQKRNGVWHASSPRIATVGCCR
jgi:2-polyprenyl-6-methoxyphenol hydroxylase-like FAD-dependent oxidoreductase